METLPSEPRIDTRKASLIPWWTWVLGAGLAAATIIVAWIVLILYPVPAPPPNPLYPLFTVYPASTFTPVPPTLTWTPDVSPTPEPQTPVPGTLGIGVLVEIVNTGGQGLRFRDAPTTNAKVLFSGLEHELFRIVDGPRASDGFNWWLMEGMLDSTRQGWAVDNYLKPTIP